MRYSQVSLAVTLYDDDMFRATIVVTRWREGRMHSSDVARQGWADSDHVEELISDFVLEVVQSERDLKLTRG